MQTDFVSHGVKNRHASRIVLGFTSLSSRVKGRQVRETRVLCRKIEQNAACEFDVAAAVGLLSAASGRIFHMEALVQCSKLSWPLLAGKINIRLGPGEGLSTVECVFLR